MGKHHSHFLLKILVFCHCKLLQPYFLWFSPQQSVSVSVFIAQVRWLHFSRVYFYQLNPAGAQHTSVEKTSDHWKRGSLLRVWVRQRVIKGEHGLFHQPRAAQFCSLWRLDTFVKKRHSSGFYLASPKHHSCTKFKRDSIITSDVFK